jgi:hypothetical protein
MSLHPDPIRRKCWLSAGRGARASRWTRRGQTSSRASRKMEFSCAITAKPRADESVVSLLQRRGAAFLPVRGMSCRNAGFRPGLQPLRVVRDRRGRNRMLRAVRFCSESGHRSRSLPPPAFGERHYRGLAGRSVPARGSSAADLTTRYIPSHTPSLETDWVGKTHRAPTPGPDTVVAWHSCSCR